MNKVPNFSKTILSTEINNLFPEIKNEFAGVVQSFIEKGEEVIKIDEYDDSWVTDMAYSDALGEGINYSIPRNFEEFDKLTKSVRFRAIILKLIINNKKFSPFIGNFGLLTGLNTSEEVAQFLKIAGKKSSINDIIHAIGEINYSETEQFKKRAIEFTHCYLFLKECISGIYQRLTQAEIDNLFLHVRQKEEIEKRGLKPFFLKEYLIIFIINEILNIPKIDSKNPDIWGIGFLWKYLMVDENLKPSNDNWDNKAIKEFRGFTDLINLKTFIISQSNPVK